MADEKKLKLAPGLKERWVKELRSGKYLQAKGTLKGPVELEGGSEGVGYCCLGVLCAISKKVRDQVEDWETNALLDASDGTSVVLSSDIQTTLAAKNDDGDSFKKIARYIERSKSI